MADEPRPVPVWRDVDAKLFHETIVPLGRPAVLKGLVSAWPAVQAGLVSPAELARYLGKFADDQPVPTISVGPDAAGRFFYRPDMRAFNFERRPQSLRGLLDDLIAGLGRNDGSARAAQSAPVATSLPGFEQHNRSTLLDSTVAPRIWIGDRAVVAAHFDLFENIACVVGGRRRFTLFPPEQVRNLYVGPIELTPAGVPISVVDFDRPDLERYPRFAEAMDAAEVAELEPGDAIYIPYLWWHHVRALEGFNVLVNYWWNRTAAGVPPPMAALMLALISLRDLPPAYRDAWHGLFEHWVFQAHGEPMAHLPPEVRGGLAATTPGLRQLAATSLMRMFGGGASGRQGRG
jgi:hypothetical protein